MKIGIGLPNPVPGVEGRTLVEWARRAEERGFSTLATIDRIAFPSYESLIALAAAGAVTDRIRLLTNVILAPTRNPVLLAKEAASVDQISGGRLTLGIGVGGREDDFTAASAEYRNRGRRLDEDLELIHQAWKGKAVAGSPKAVTPAPVREGRIPLLVGGYGEAGIRRAVKWGVGWTAGGSPPETVAEMAKQVRQEWQEAGREGEPEIVALVYYVLGEDAFESGEGYIKEYYGYFGPGAEQMAKAIPHTVEAVRGTVQAYKDAGVTELIFDPTVARLDQVDKLADAVL